MRFDIHSPAAQAEAAFGGFPHPLRIAVMGCVVNGPGEFREAGIGVPCGNGKGQIFVKGRGSAPSPKYRSPTRSSEKPSN